MSIMPAAFGQLVQLWMDPMAQPEELARACRVSVKWNNSNKVLLFMSDMKVDSTKYWNSL